MPLIGHARVSTRDQHPEAQTDALSAAGCEKVFVDHASGTLTKRTALEQALDYLRAGDTLVNHQAGPTQPFGAQPQCACR